MAFLVQPTIPKIESFVIKSMDRVSASAHGVQQELLNKELLLYTGKNAQPVIKLQLDNFPINMHGMLYIEDDALIASALVSSAVATERYHHEGGLCCFIDVARACVVHIASSLLASCHASTSGIQHVPIDSILFEGGHELRNVRPHKDDAHEWTVFNDAPVVARTLYYIEQCLWCGEPVRECGMHTNTTRAVTQEDVLDLVDIWYRRGSPLS